MKIRSSSAVIYLLLFPLLFTSQVYGDSSPNTPMTMVEIVGGVIVAVEGINLLVHALGNVQFQGNRPKMIVTAPPPETNDWAYNLIAMTNTASPTNITPPVTNIVVRPVTNAVSPPPVTNIVLNITPVSNTNRAVTQVTNKQGPESNLLSIKPSILSNLSESEKQDIMLFGKDYYYLVSLAYFKVGKKEKSREFMFHSLAIEVRVPEGTKFLREGFGLNDAEIRAGKARYVRSHE